MTYRQGVNNADWQQVLLEHCQLFADLPPDIIRRTLARPVLRSFPVNHVIFLENDGGASIHFILQGWVKIRTHNLDGKEITLNILTRGDLFGEMAALEQIPRSTDVITLVDTQVCSIPAEDFLNLVATEPKAGMRLAQLLALRLRQVNRRLRLREADSTARLTDVLLFLADGQGKHQGQGCTIPSLPHRELSSLSGLARETVTRVLSKLEKRGLIERDRSLMHIPDLEALERIVG
ncbi:MAG: Crp/Fnr family transcriptional regulator [Synechococcales cyanobacterium RM1_1_8]|nr:Crp/Fnr family transcriptional regulator [Synechococcales cyanobacterium RM1_1_8]